MATYNPNPNVGVSDNAAAAASQLSGVLFDVIERSRSKPLTEGDRIDLQNAIRIYGKAIRLDVYEYIRQKFNPTGGKL